MSPSRARNVAVSCPPGSALGAALRAALQARGWSVHDALAPVAGQGRVVLLEDDAGVPWPPAQAPPPARTVGIGSLRTAAALAGLATQGAAVVHDDVPFPVLLALVESALLRDAPPVPLDARLRMAARVRARAAEAGALAALTSRERDVLGALLLGRSAPAIAEESSRSLTTIRSQVQSMMRRLDVGTQLEAVAIAHRSGWWAGLGDPLTALHQF